MTIWRRGVITNYEAKLGDYNIDSHKSSSVGKRQIETNRTSGSAMAEGPRDALVIEILQLQNIPFEN